MLVNNTVMRDFVSMKMNVNLITTDNIQTAAL